MVSLTFDKTITAPIIGKIARMRNMVLKPNISAIIPAIIVPVTAPKVIAEFKKQTGIDVAQDKMALQRLSFYQARTPEQLLSAH